MNNAIRSCSFSDCNKKHKGHGLCQGHLIQKKKGYPLSSLDGTRRNVQKEKQCSADGCTAPCRCKGLCKRHYAKDRASKSSFVERKNKRLSTMFGITFDRYSKMLQAQNGFCAICKTDDPGGRWGLFNVDHNRACCPGLKTCGKCVRGLLCFGCNVGLGLALDDINILTRAVAYLGNQNDKTL